MLSHVVLQVSGYPEGHPDVIKKVSDLGRPLTATEKVRSATAIVKQFFVSCTCWLSFAPAEQSCFLCYSLTLSFPALHSGPACVRWRI